MLFSPLKKDQMGGRLSIRSSNQQVFTADPIPSKPITNFCKRTGTEAFAFLHPYDLESMSRSLRLVSRCGIQWQLSPCQVRTKLVDTI